MLFTFYTLFTFFLYIDIMSVLHQEPQQMITHSRLNGPFLSGFIMWSRCNECKHRGQVKAPSPSYRVSWIGAQTCLSNEASPRDRPTLITTWESLCRLVHTPWYGSIEWRGQQASIEKNKCFCCLHSRWKGRCVSLVNACVPNIGYNSGAVHSIQRTRIIDRQYDNLTTDTSLYRPSAFFHGAEKANHRTKVVESC